jgi:hypothetical protein
MKNAAVARLSGIWQTLTLLWLKVIICVIWARIKLYLQVGGVVLYEKDISAKG